MNIMFLCFVNPLFQRGFKGWKPDVVRAKHMVETFTCVR
jgi:hypothetical protein